MNIKLKLILLSILISLSSLSFSNGNRINPTFEYQEQGVVANLTTSHIGEYSETNLEGSIIVSSDRGARPICAHPPSDQCQRSPERTGAVTIYHDIGASVFTQTLDDIRGNIESGIYSFSINNKGDLLSIDYPDEFVTKIFQIDFITGSATILDTVSHLSETWNKGITSRLDGSGQILVTDSYGVFSLSNDGSTLFLLRDKIYEYKLTNIGDSLSSLHSSQEDYYYIDSYLFNEQTKKMEQIGGEDAVYGWSLMSVLPIGDAGIEYGLTIHSGPVGDRFALLSSGVSYFYSKNSETWQQTSSFDIATLSPSHSTDCESDQRKALSSDFSTIIFSDSSCDRALILKLHEGSLKRVQEIYGVGDKLGISATSNIDGSKIFIANERNGTGQVSSMPYDYAGYVNSYYDVCIADCTADSDSDGVLDSEDIFPNNPLEWGDTDDDTVGNFSDNCPFNRNSAQSDFDGDLLGDVCDLDDDGDGVLDFNDAMPLDPDETQDFDGDGIGDNADQDDDNDGWNDDVDDFPYDSTEYIDSDGDGVGDNGDVFPNDASETVDSDGDGVGNNGDQFPNDSYESKDSDSDGFGDNLEGLVNSDKNSTRSQPEHFSVIGNAIFIDHDSGVFSKEGYSPHWIATKTGFIGLLSPGMEVTTISPRDRVINSIPGMGFWAGNVNIKINSGCNEKATYLLEYSRNNKQNTPHNFDITLIDCSTNYNGNLVSEMRLLEIQSRWYAVLKFSAFEIKIIEIDRLSKQPIGTPFSYSLPSYYQTNDGQAAWVSHANFDVVGHDNGIYITYVDLQGKLTTSAIDFTSAPFSISERLLEPYVFTEEALAAVAPLDISVPVRWKNVYPINVKNNLGLIYAKAKDINDSEIDYSLPDIYSLAIYDKSLNLVSDEVLITAEEGHVIICCDSMENGNISWMSAEARPWTIGETVNGDYYETTYHPSVDQPYVPGLKSFYGAFDDEGSLGKNELFMLTELGVEAGSYHAVNYEGFNASNNLHMPIFKGSFFDTGVSFTTMKSGITLTHLGVLAMPKADTLEPRRFHQYASQSSPSSEVQTHTIHSNCEPYRSCDYFNNDSVAEKVGNDAYWLMRKMRPIGGLYNIPAGAKISRVAEAMVVSLQTQYFKVDLPSYVDLATVSLALSDATLESDISQYFEFDKVHMQIKVVGYPPIPNDWQGTSGRLIVTLEDKRITQEFELVVVFEDTYTLGWEVKYIVHDADKDGYPDNHDAFPNDVTEVIDTDSDGIGNNADSDDDNDGFTDEQEFIDGTDPLSKFSCREGCASLDLDGSERYDALTDGLLLLRGMFGLDGSALIRGTIAADAIYTSSVDITTRINNLGSAADIDGNGEIDALTDGLLTLRYLFGLEGDTLINGVVAGDATRKTAEEIEAHLETLMPAL